MKRREFLATTGTVGIASTVSGASLVSSTYSSISNSILLKEFTPELKGALEKFKSEAILNAEDLGLDKKYALRVTMPTQIINKKSVKGLQRITYKNKAGNYVLLTVDKKGVESIQILETLNR